MKTSCLAVALPLASLALLALPAPARAETDPRDYALALAPDHTNVFLAYGRHQTSADSEDLVQNVSLFRYIHLLKFGHLALAPIDFVLPVADAQLYTAAGTLNGSGLGDLAYLPTIAYVVDESEQNQTYFAFSPYFHAPTGNYDAKRVINIGNHRWQFDEEVCVGQRFAGAFFVEAVGAATFYTKNDDFIPPSLLATGQTTAFSLSQAPTLSATLHASANVTKSIWVGASYYATANGKYTLATPAGNQTAVEEQTVQSVRATVGIRPVEPFLLLVQYQNDLAATNGATISRFLGARASYVF
jgi:hypothetical protein